MIVVDGQFHEGDCERKVYCMKLCNIILNLKHDILHTLTVTPFLIKLEVLKIIIANVVPCE